MGFRINTNVAALNAHRNSIMNNQALNQNLTRLSSGLRINKAADDASGLAIADSLNSQATGLGQAIRNANDGINVAQTADGALQEYTNIINTVRTKAIQAASDGQNKDSRMAIQRDISKLLEEADNIAKTTSFNGQNLLDGSFSDKNFQIGAYANETVGMSIDSTRTAALGKFALKDGTEVTTNALADNDLKVNGINVGASTAGSDNSLGQAAESAYAKTVAINSVQAQTGVTATSKTTVEGAADVAGGSIDAGSVYVNGIDLGDVTFSANDNTGTLVAAFNKIEDQTGVHASIIDGGKLKLTSDNGWNIDLTSDSAGSTVIADGDMDKLFGGHTNNVIVDRGDGNTTATTLDKAEHGYITLESDDAITIAGNNPGYAGLTAGTVSLANSISSADVTTYDAAQLTIKKADHALKQLDTIRSNIGSVQNQLESTVRNISVTQVNVTAARSTIMDVDFAAESASFAKHNILAQSGSYAMSQANAVQQNVLRLLQ